MSDHIQQTIADLAAKRDQISEVIAKLEWFRDEFPRTAAAMSIAKPNGQPGAKRHNKRQKRRLARVAVALSRDVSEKGQAILAELRKKNPRRPGELATAVGLNNSTALRYHAQALLKAKQIVLLGSGAGTKYALPGTAKEGL